ncbi:MAG: IS1595 family transposase [Chthoniobacter sp.]|nr:IS1595 family transposase [Chthoniobacter sp.]
MSTSKANPELPETLMSAMNFFNEGDNAFDLLVKRRWPDGVVKCPTCDSATVRFIPARKLWECCNKHPRRQFSVKVGTIFEDSPISLAKWMAAFWLISNCKNGVSSYEIHRSLGITQKTGWFMLQRIRLALQSGTIVRDKLKGLVEVDESYIGGLARNMHKDVKERKVKGRGPGSGSHKTAVQGLLQRHIGKCSKVVAEVILENDGATLKDNVRKYVLEGTEVHTDAHRSYCGLSEHFIHEVIDHAEAYARDGVTTNGLENFWSLLKRTLRGTYVSVEPFHLFRYLSEQVFRFNERKHEAGDQGRFLLALEGIFGKRLTYKKLVGDDAAGLLAA